MEISCRAIKLAVTQSYYLNVVFADLNSMAGLFHVLVLLLPVEAQEV